MRLRIHLDLPSMRHNVYSIGEDLSSLCQTNKWEWKWREKQTEYRNRGNRFWFSMMFCMYWLNPLPVVSGFEPTRNPEEIMQSFVHLLRQLRPSSFRKVGLASMLCTIFTVFLRWNRFVVSLRVAVCDTCRYSPCYQVSVSKSQSRDTRLSAQIQETTIWGLSKYSRHYNLV